MGLVKHSVWLLLLWCGFALGQVRINEFMAVNDRSLLDQDGASSDWIELYNAAAETVSLAGFYLTNDRADLKKWAFPEVSIAPSGYLALFASEKDRFVNNELHTNFSLNGDGDYLALVAPDGRTILSEFGESFPQQRSDISYGYLNGDTYYLSTATPGQLNSGETALGICEKPKFDQKRGFYEVAFQLNLSADRANETIRYTLDGSTPSAVNGFTFDGTPLTIEKTSVVRAVATRAGYLNSAVVSHTYLFIDDIRQQAATPPTAEWPADRERNNQHMDYEMSAGITAHASYAKQMNYALKVLPVISLSTDLDHLFSASEGIYVNALNEGELWERPVSIELFNEQAGDEFQINGGVRIRGGFSASADNAKHSFRLFFKNRYDGALDFPLFDEEGADSFAKVDLRTAQNYSWSMPEGNNAAYYSFVRDVFSRDTQRAMGNLYSRSRYYHLYLNGVYWGLYQTQERTDANFAASYLGDEPAVYDVIKSTGADLYDREATDGTTAAYDRLWNLANQGFTSNQAYFQAQGLNDDGTKNPTYERLLDVDNLIDYMILITYTGNWDMAIDDGVNNFYAIYNRENPDGFKWLCHDSEHTLIHSRGGVDYDMVSYQPSALLEDFNAFYLHQRLLENPLYKQRFADRLYKQLNHQGALTVEHCISRWESRAAEIKYAVVAESARWGDARFSEYGKTFTVEDWQAAVDDMVNNYFPARATYYLSQVYTNNWLPAHFAHAIDWGKPVQIFHFQDEIIEAKVTVEPNYSINFSPASGATLYYTLDGSDPMLANGTVNPEALSSTEMVQLILPATRRLQARNWINGNWSVLRTVDFKVFSDVSPLRVTEIQAFPKASQSYTAEQLEFLELYNSGSSAIDLSGCQFTKGIRGVFPSGTILLPNNYLVVAADLTAFTAHYGKTPALIYSGQLADHGERLKLVDSLGNEIFDFSYTLSLEERYLAYGQGFTLVHDLASSEINPNETAYWSTSSAVDGSPGSENLVVSSSTLYIHEIANGGNPSQRFIELYNDGSAAVDLANWQLFSDSGTVYTFPAGRILEPKGYLAIYEDNDDSASNNSSLGTDFFGASFSLNALGGRLYLVAPAGNYSQVLSFGACEAGCSWNRFIDSAGKERLVYAHTVTPGTVNASPVVGPLVMTEISYKSDIDFIEIKNVGPVTVALDGWKVDGVNFVFPENQSLAPNGILLLVRDQMTPDTFRARYQVPAEVMIFSFDGAISSAGETLKILRPGGVISGDFGAFVPSYPVDVVAFEATAPWPVQAAEFGKTLERVEETGYGNDPANWQASDYDAGSPGYLGQVYQLKVKNGTGAGNYPTGTVVTIAADPAVSPQVFGEWVGGTGEVAMPNASTTTVTMGMTELAVEATYTFASSPLTGTVKINEFMAENKSAFLNEESFDFADWVELAVIDSNLLSGETIYITNDPTEPQKWPIPSLSAYQHPYYLLYLDQLAYDNHASFSLKKGKGYLGIFDSANRLIDEIQYAGHAVDVSYGKNGAGVWQFFGQSTPGEVNPVNGLDNLLFADQPQPSIPAGFYTTTQTVSLTVTAGTIHYTLDGTIPNENSPIYSQPLTISKNTVLRAVNLEPNKLPSALLNASYFINESSTLPVVSISMPEDYIFDDQVGFYVQGTNGVPGYSPSFPAANYKRDWRRPAAIEFFETDGTQAFASDGEVKIYGGWSREAIVKSWGVYFTETVKHPIFAQGKVDTFDSLVLRNGGNDWSGSKMDDAVGQKCVEGQLDLDMQRSRPALLFVNGQYWATMNIREKLNEDYIKNYHGYDDDEVDLLDDPYTANAGDTLAYQALLDFTAENDLSLPGNFDYVNELVDLKELGHYWMVEAYSGNGDWANSNGTRFNNIKWWRGRDDKGQWRWMLYDMDGGFRGSGGGANYYYDGVLGTFPFLRDALNYGPFRTWYIQRATAMTNILYDGDRVEQVVNDFRAAFGPELPRHITRWQVNDNTAMDPVSAATWWIDPNHPYFIQSYEGYNYESDGHLGSGGYADWLADGDSIIQFGHGRPSVYLSQLKSYFGLGDLLPVNFEVDGAEGGQIAVNGVNSDQLLFSGQYFAEVPMVLKAEPAEGWTFAEWQIANAEVGQDTLISKNSVWKYFDQDNVPAVDWMAASYDDSSWSSGPGTLGYSDARVTVITADSNGDGAKNMAAYFRKTVEITNPADYSFFFVNVLVDDGFVLYVNGQEAGRFNMPTGVISHSTPATTFIAGADEQTYHTQISIPNYLLESGTNLIAVEVHQNSASSSDLGFDLEMKAGTSVETTLTNPEITITLKGQDMVKARFKKRSQLVINEITAAPQQGGAYEFVELLNASEKSANLGGYSFSGIHFTFPADTYLNAGELMVVAANHSLLNLPDGVQGFTWSGGDLADGGETLALLDTNKAVVDEVTFLSDATWPTVDALATFELKDQDLDNELGANWRQSFYENGSPGLKNNWQHPIILSEIYYNPPKSQGPDEDYEFLEIYNRGDYSLNLAGYEFKDGISFTFPANSWINPGEYVLVAANSSTYAGNGYQVFEWASGALSNSGETLKLDDCDGKKVFEVTYDNKMPWPLKTDGEGHSLVLKELDGAVNKAESWGTSLAPGGSPGTENRTSVVPALLINEVLAHTDWPANVDAIEIYNPTAENVDLSGWFLTDDQDNLQQYEIPANTMILADGYKTIYEDNDGDPNNNLSLPAEFFGRSFSLSSHGETIWLISPNLDYFHEVDFPASENGVSFSRYVNSEAQELFFPSTSLTLDAPNSAPKSSPVVIAEIMYNPADGQSDFVEIWNQSAESQPLFNTQYPEYSWKIDGLAFEFPANITLQANERILIIPDMVSVETFKLNNEIDARVFQYSGNLSDSGERLTLLRPDKPDPDLVNGGLIVPYITVETVNYATDWPWPKGANGPGYSLVRRLPLAFADDPQAWTASARLKGSPAMANVKLDVINGTGSGVYEFGAEIQIQAQVPTERNFYRWTGDTATVTDIYATTTTVNLQSSALTVEANWQGVPQITWQIPNPITYGERLDASFFNAQADTPGTFEYSLTNGQLLASGNWPFTLTFTPTDPVAFEGLSLEKSLEVNQANLVLTAPTLQVRQNSGFPDLFPEATGLVNNEDLETALSALPTILCAVNETSNPGLFPLTVDLTGITAPNYTLTTEPGALFIFEEERLSDLEVTLYPGWNLISLPFQNIHLTDYFNDEQMLGEPWEWTAGSYAVFDVNEPLKVESGYWIYSAAEQSATIAQDHTQQQLPDFHHGWNLHGVLWPQNASIFNVDRVWRWDGATQSYQLSDALEPGLGYWFYVENPE